MELLTPQLGLIFWQTVVFLGLFFILRKFAWAGITTAIKDREESIDSALKMAEETRAEMAKLKSDNDKVLAEARIERDNIIKEAKNVADRLVSEAKEKAQTEGAKVLEQAREDISIQRNAMMAQVRKDVAQISIEIAEKVLRKELADKTAQEKLVSDLLVDAKLN